MACGLQVISPTGTIARPEPYTAKSAALDHDRDLFPTVVWRNTRYWANRRAAASERAPRYVLVDLLVDHPVYYLGNLIIAKYLEMSQGLRPWALVSSESDRTITLLARSFGIEDFTFVRDEVTASVSPAVNRILAALDGLKGGALRRRILGLEIDGIPVGDLLYDTCLRETRRITLERVDDDLRFYTALLVNYHRLYGSLLERHEIAAVVLGHLVYCRFGVLARRAVQSGAAIYGRHGGKGMILARKRTLEEAGDFIGRIPPELVEATLAAEGDVAVAAGRATLERRLGGTDNEFVFLNEEGYSTRRPRWTRDEFRNALGLEEGRPVGLVMLHAFPDASHQAPRLLFDDFYQWYLRTMEIAADTPEVTWIVKPHPNLGHYTDDERPARIAADYVTRHRHIHLAPEGINTRSFAEIADFLVTVNSKAGLEFAGLGIPAVLAGRAFYAGLGFTVEPPSAAAYADALREAAGLTLSEDQRRRALVANDLFYRRMMCDCVFIPDTPYNFWTPFDEVAFWRGYLEALDRFRPEDDPLYRAVPDFFAGEAPAMLRPEAA